MIIELPLLKQEMVGEEILTTEKDVKFEIDTSVYSEERWEINFPHLAQHEGLFSYIERISENAISEKVKVIAMLKAIYCFIESKEVSSYKEFAKMFILSAPEYVSKLISKLTFAFKLVLKGSAVKN